MKALRAKKVVPAQPAPLAKLSSLRRTAAWPHLEPPRDPWRLPRTQGQFKECPAQVPLCGWSVGGGVLLEQLAHGKCASHTGAIATAIRSVTSANVWAGSLARGADQWGSSDSPKLSTRRKSRMWECAIALSSRSRL